ncbi:MAG: sodium/proton-translocating pyrophosphatase, partial [Sphaerochaeta sp.]
MGLLISVVLTSLLGFFLCIRFVHWIKNQRVQSETVHHIASLIEDGSQVFLRREMVSLLLFCSVMALLLALLLPEVIFLHPSIANLTVALTYLGGCSLSALCAMVGMGVATKANARTAEAAQTSLGSAFLISFRGGSVMGIFVVCTSLLGITLLLAIGADAIHLFSFSFGASSLALFAKAGGGIFTKTADISADLVGKVELGLAEDDYHNPAVIADNVGDNVGDVAGMGCDLFDSYVASLTASLVMAFSLGRAYISLILAYSLCGMASTILMVGSVRLGTKHSVSTTLNRNTWGTSILFLASSLLVTLGMNAPLRLYLCSMVGLGVGTLIGLITNHYTDDRHAPVQKVAAMGRQGPAFTVLGGFSYGLLSTLPALIGIALAALL